MIVDILFIELFILIIVLFISFLFLSLFLNILSIEIQMETKWYELGLRADEPIYQSSRQNICVLAIFAFYSIIHK